MCIRDSKILEWEKYFSIFIKNTTQKNNYIAININEKNKVRSAKEK